MGNSVMLWTFALLLQAAASAPEEAFPSRVAAQASASLAPAICVVSYSTAITNPNTGHVNKREATGLGLVVNAKGLVMAHGHMSIQDAEPANIRVKVGQGEEEVEYPATLLEKPEDVNICFLQIQHDVPLNLPFARFTPGYRFRIGEQVLIIGLLSETLDYSRAVNTRLVSAIIDKPRTTYCLNEPLSLGYVGGPVVNAAGQVVGVVGYDLSPEEGGDLYVRSGHPLIYQADLFAKYIESPPGESETEAKDAWLGVLMQPLTDDLAEYWGLPKDGGVVISTVVPGSPAESAGLKRGDVVVDFDGTPVRVRQDREVSSFTKLIRDAGVGKEVKIKFLRDGQPMELAATLIQRPKTARDAEEFEDVVFGLTVREITTDLRLLLNLPDDVQGVIIRRVKSGSAADEARMRPGLIIMRFGEFPVANLAEYEAAAAKVAEMQPQEFTVFCRARTGAGFFRMAPQWKNDAEKR